MFEFTLEKATKLAKQKNWDKLRHKLNKNDPKIGAIVAQACSTVDDDGSYNILIELMKHDQRPIKLAAVRGLGELGRDAARTHISWLKQHTPESDTEMHAAISEAMAKIRHDKN
ncbi:MAG: hypothetical protein ACI4QW_03005 [Clostridia bacterium]